MAALANILSFPPTAIPIPLGGGFPSSIHFSQLPIFIAGILIGPAAGLVTGAIGGVSMSFFVGAKIPFIVGGLAILGCANYPEGGKDIADMCAEFANRRYIVVTSGCAAMSVGMRATPPKDYPQDEEDYADPVNYAYPLVPEDRCRNALARRGAFREEYTQTERNVVYERLVRRALKYGITVRYQPDLPEANALPENVKEQLEGYETADTLIAKVKALVKQLNTA